MPQENVHKSSLEFIWSQYRCWAATAQKLKKELSLWRIVLVIVTIVGSFTAILSQQVSNIDVSKVLAWISTGAIGIAGYASSKMLTGENEKKWLQARAAAENCKSNAYLYLLKSPPYDESGDDTLLFEKVQGLIGMLSTIPQATLTRDQEIKNIPPETYSFTDYTNDRIFKQAKQYYLPKAETYRKYLKRASYAGIALAAIGFLLGSTGSQDPANSPAIWIAFVSTAAAALTSFIAASRYQYLSMSFQATGNQLMVLWYKATRITPDDIEAQRNLVTNCEKVLATENEAWMTELGKSVPDNDQAS